MEESTEEKILREYDEKRDLYLHFTDQLKRLLDLNLANSVFTSQIVLIEARAKEVESLRRKLSANAERGYASLTDITDLSGLRIVTMFRDDVEPLAKRIREIFDVDWEHSIDKAEMLSPDRFGYLSLHYVVRLPDSALLRLPVLRLQGSASRDSNPLRFATRMGYREP